MQQSNTLVIVLLVVVILAVAYFMFMRPQTPTIVQTSPTGTGGEISNTTLWATSIMNLLGGIGNSIAAGFNASSNNQGGQEPVTD